MMNMANFGSVSWLFGWHIHLIFGFIALAGAILFIVWAAKLKSADLKQWVVWLLLVGIIGHLLTSSWGMLGYKNMMGAWNQPMMWSQMAEHMMEEGHEDLKTSEDWRNHMLEEMEEHMNF